MALQESYIITKISSDRRSYEKYYLDIYNNSGEQKAKLIGEEGNVIKVLSGKELFNFKGFIAKLELEGKYE